MYMVVSRKNNDLLCDIKWRGGWNVLSGSGKRFIINHVGSEDGCVSGCGEYFREWINWRKAVLHTRKIENTFCELYFGNEGQQKVDKALFCWIQKHQI